MDYRATRGTLAMQFNAVKRHFGRKITVTGIVIDTFIGKGDTVNILDKNQIFFLANVEVIEIKSTKKPKKPLVEASPGEAVTLLLGARRASEDGAEESEPSRIRRVRQGFFLAKPHSL